MYGHGYSEGTRGWIPETWEHNKQDYINFCNQIVVPDMQKLLNASTTKIPLFLSGESYGGCLTIHVAKHFQEHPEEPASSLVKGMILNAPAIIGDLPPLPVVFVLRYCLAPFFPTWIPFFMPNPISPDRIWRDPEVLERNSRKGRYMNMGIDMSGRPYRLGTALNLVLALKAVRDIAIPGLTIPYLCQHGTCDYGVPISGSELLCNKCSITRPEDKILHRHQGGYHDLLAEPNAEQVVQHMIDFIHQRI
jgi:alpha-beta hydrolase superfamily lysophospholipase